MTDCDRNVTGIVNVPTNGRFGPMSGWHGGCIVLGAKVGNVRDN